jgi:hypothetical protein
MIIEVSGQITLSPYENVMVVPVKSREKAAKAIEETVNAKHPVCEIREKQEKRSLEANGYLWKLCTEISKILSKESPISKEDVYRRAVREGNCYYAVPIKDEAVKHYQKIWASNGIGWFAEIAYKSTLDGFTTLHAYYGSSQYNTHEMWELVRIIQEEAETLGIETRTPEGLNSLMESWDKAYKKREEKSGGLSGDGR